MPRLPRVEYPGAIYHVTVRMVGHAWETGARLDPRDCLFQNNADRARFLDQLGERVEDFGIRLYAYCLMLTHFHLYLETPKGNLSRFMHSVETAYTVYSNLRRERHGPMVGRYKAKPVEGDTYHLAVSRYIHLNPVRTAAASRMPAEERKQRLDHYRWSSYRAYVARDEAPAWLRCGPVLALCGRTPGEQRRKYRRLVESALGKTGQAGAMPANASALAIGGEEFADWIRAKMMERGRQRGNPQDNCLRALAVHLPVERVLEVTANRLGVQPGAFAERHRHSDRRGIAVRMLCRHAGLTQRRAAMALGMGTGAAAGKQLRRIEQRVRTDRRLRQTVDRIEAALDGEARR